MTCLNCHANVLFETMMDKVFRAIRHKIKRRLLHTSNSFSRVNYKLSDLDKAAFLKIENDLKQSQVCYENSNEDTQITYPLLVGGADLSYFGPDNDCEQAVVCYVIAQYRLAHQIKPEIIYEKWKKVDVKFPYMQGSGFFWARESQPIIDMVKEQILREPEKTPNYLLIDGNGMFHLRKFGLACKVGTELNIPTIGVAKTYDCLNTIFNGGNYADEQQELKEHLKDLDIGGHLELKHPSDNEVVGYALRPDYSKLQEHMYLHLSYKSAKNPIYVSVGHKVSLLKAKTIALRTCLFRLPEPIRQADIISREAVRCLKKDEE